MKALVGRLVREDAGQDLIEYGLLVGLITALVVGAIATIGTKVTGYFTTLNANLP
jgi:pilus assembly protein Flp/PilA